MPLTRQQKEQRVAEIQEAVSGAGSVVFVGFDGLALPDINELRNKLQEEGSRMRVMPKTLLRLAMQNAKLDFDPMTQKGQIAVIWGPDAVVPAKVLHTFAKEHDNLRLLAGVLEGSVLSLERVTSLAQLPSRQELLGQLVGVLAGPMRGFVSVLSGVPRATVYVLQAIKNKKQP